MGLDLRVFEMLVDEVSHADGEHGLPHFLVAGAADVLIDLGEGRGFAEPVAVKDGRGPLPEACPFRVGLCVLFREAGKLLCIPVVFPVGHDVVAVREGVEAEGGEWDDVQPVIAQLQIVDNPALHDVQDVGAVGNVEAGCEFVSHYGAAHHLKALQHEDFQAFLGQVSGGDEAVVARPDDDGVVLVLLHVKWPPGESGLVEHDDTSGDVGVPHVFEGLVDVFKLYALGDDLVELQAALSVELHVLGHVHAEVI